MDPVNHPVHYGGKDNSFEAIKVIEAWNPDFNLGNCLKYLSRAGKKHSDKLVEDLEKALWYLKRYHKRRIFVKQAQESFFTYNPEKVIEAWGLKNRLASVVTYIGLSCFSYDPLSYINKAITLLEAEVNSLKGVANETD